MANPFSWGVNEPVIEPVADGGDTIAVYAQKMYNALDSVIDTLNTYPWDPCLPLSGGSMSGDIANAGTGILRILGGSTVNNGARLALVHEDNAQNPGEFWLVAKQTGVGDKSLIGKPDGTLTWDGKSVETNVSNTTAYYRLSNGLQILTGTGNSLSSGPVHINFSHAFAANPRVAITGGGSSTTLFAPKADNISTTGFDLYDIGVNGYINNAFNYWLAFGIGA